MAGISLIQKLQKLFGARAVSDMMGRTTNVQTLAQGTNNPFARTFSRKYLANNPDGVEEASKVILENMQFAFGNRNIQQMKNFENNVNTLYNLKFPPKPTEAKVVDIGTKKQVTGEGLESLKDDLGLPKDISPTSPLGQTITKTKRLDKTIDQQAKKYSVMDEAFRRPVIRDMLLNDTRINLPENVRKSLRNREDLQRGGDPMMDPLQIFQKYYNYDTKALEQLDDMANLMSISGFSSDEIAKAFIKRGGLEPKNKKIIRESLDDETVEITEQNLLDDPDDDIPFAQGGRAGFNVGGIAKLLNFLQGKLGKKAITTADKIARPESALNREMFGEFNKRMNRRILDVEETPSGFKLSKEKLLKNFPEIDEKMADEIMTLDRDLQLRVITMLKDRRKNPDAYDKLLMEKGDTLDFQGEFDRSVQRSKNAQGGIAGQLHLNQGGRVGLQEGGPPNKGRRNFLKLMAGVASLPVVGKLFKFAKPAAKIVPLQNTSTAMPTWFPKFVDKFVSNSVGKKIDADLMEFKNPDLPDVKVKKHDDGRVYVEGNNEYNEGYQIEYKPPGYEVVDEKTGKAVKTPGDFDAVEGRHVAVGPEDYDTDPFYVDDLDELTTIDVAEMEKYATGKVTKTVKDAFGQDTGVKKGVRSYDMAVGQAENEADRLRELDILDPDGEDFASGGRVGLLSGGGILKAMLKNLAKEKGMSGSELLAVMNYKALPSKIRNLMTEKQFEELKNARLRGVKNFRNMMQSRLDFNKSIQRGKTIENEKTGLSQMFDLLEKNLGKKMAVPKNITEEDILQMEQMIKNMEMKGRKPNAAGGLAGQLKL